VTIATASAAPRSGAPNTSRKRWSDALVLWVAALAAQALVLFLLAQFTLQQQLAWDSELISVAISRGDVEAAESLASQPAYLLFPASVLVVFGLVGLAVLALAWTGRRTLAWLLPFGIALASIGPAYRSPGSSAPQPISELRSDWLGWGSLVAAPTQELSSASTWPLLLGVGVQTALLLLPLVAAPVRRAEVPLSTAVRWAAVPTAVLMIVSLAFTPYPGADDLYRLPLAAAAVGLLAGAMATGVGTPWLRLPASVLVPAVTGLTMITLEPTDALQGVVHGALIATGALWIVLGTLVAPELTPDRLRRRHGSVVDVPVSA
jgi:hypothetical protein